MSNENVDKENQNTFFLSLTEEILNAMFIRGDISKDEKDKLLKLSIQNFPCNKGIIASYIA